jgi:hypothetical protein
MALRWDQHGLNEATWENLSTFATSTFGTLILIFEKFLVSLINIGNREVEKNLVIYAYCTIAP